MYYGSVQPASAAEEPDIHQLLAKIRSPNIQTVVEAIKEIGARRDPVALEPLSALLNNPAKAIRKEAALALGNIPGEDSVIPLIKALKDTSSDVRAASAKALGNKKSQSAINALIDALKDGNFLVRGMAAASLGLIGDECAVPPLTNALKDPDNYVRQCADQAILRIQGNQGGMNSGIETAIDPGDEIVKKQSFEPYTGKKPEIAESD